MRTISVCRFVPGDPSVVWDLLVDTSRWAEWGPSVTEVDLSDVRLRANSEGRIRSPFGFWVPFRVTEFEDNRSWTWAVAGVPATSHCVTPAPGGCVVSIGMPAIAASYTLVCRTALRRIERLAQAAPES